jgi:hypothetical protein
METAFTRSQNRLQTSIAEKEMLIREVHHRVKNNLQQIMSLLNLRSRALDNAEAASIIREYQDRLMVFSIVHEKLYIQDNLSRIEWSGLSAIGDGHRPQRYIVLALGSRATFTSSPFHLIWTVQSHAELILNEWEPTRSNSFHDGYAGTRR